MGPYAAQMLGDLGAEVVKVETEEGDGSRVMGGGPHPELSGIALNLHRNKRSIGIDLKSPGGRKVFLRLLESTDVLITNLRPGPLQRLRVDYASIREQYPRLVYCQAQGFRTDSGEAARPAYDDIIQALTGFPQLNEMAMGRMHFAPSVLADKVAALYIAQGVLAALVSRSVTGQGQQVEVPMFDATMAFMLVEHLAQAATPGGTPGYGRALTSHRGPHRTLDGWIAMMPYTDQHWTSLFSAVGCEHLLLRPYFADHRSRLANPEAVYRDLAEIILARTTDYWLELCSERGIPASPVPPLASIIEDPTHHRGVLIESLHPTVGPYRQISQPIRFSVSGQRAHEPAPLRWEDSEAVLQEAGYTPSEIAELLADGAIMLRHEQPNSVEPTA